MKALGFNWLKVRPIQVIGLNVNLHPYIKLGADNKRGLSSEGVTSEMHLSIGTAAMFLLVWQIVLVVFLRPAAGTW